MSFIKHTPNYALPQYRGEDKPKCLDFNYAFDKIDAALGDFDKRLTALEKSMDSEVPKYIQDTMRDVLKKTLRLADELEKKMSK